MLEFYDLMREVGKARSYSDVSRISDYAFSLFCAEEISHDEWCIVSDVCKTIALAVAGAIE